MRRAERRQTASVECAEPLKQFHPCGKRIGRGRIEPVQRPRIAAPREHVEQRARQIDPVDVGFPVRPKLRGLMPQAPRDAGPETRRPARALVGGVARDPFRLEAVDRAIRIVARDFVDARVDDRRDAGNRQRRFGDVRREDDPAVRDGRKGAILFGGLERSVKRDDLDRRSFRTGDARDLRCRPAYLRRAGKKTQHLSRRRSDDLCRRRPPNGVSGW